CEPGPSWPPAWASRPGTGRPGTWSGRLTRRARPSWPRGATRSPGGGAPRADGLAGWGSPAELISASAAAGLEPALRLPSPPPQVAWFPGEGYLLTEAMTGELVAAAARDGARVLTGQAGHVTGFDMARGVVRGVRTAAGQLIRADAVVCCAGRWTPGLAGLAAAASPVPLVPWARPGDTAPGLVVQ